MEDHGTIFPDWYITFQQAALAALPRPPKIDQDTALGWADNDEAMQRAFLQVLVPPSESAPTPKQREVISIDRSIPFNPAEFIGTDWTIWKGPADGDGLSGDKDQDERSLALTEIDPARVLLETCLNDREKRITGEERVLRLKAGERIRLDAAIFHSFWQNRQMIPKKWEQKINGHTPYIFFDGTLLRGPNGSRGTLYLYFCDGRWGWYCRWLGYDRYVSNPSAVLASI